MMSTVVFASGRAWVRSAFPVSSARARQLLDPCLKRISDPREKAPALARNRARPGGKGIGRARNGALRRRQTSAKLRKRLVPTEKGSKYPSAGESAFQLSAR